MLGSADRQLPSPPAYKLTARPLVLAAITLYLIFTQVSACMAGLSPAMNGQADFRSYYAAGYIVRTHHASFLYDREFERQVQSAVVTPRSADLPFVYPPFSALLFVPLSLLSYKHAYFAFFAINILLALIAAALMRPYLRAVSTFWRPLPYLGFICFFPVAIAFTQGQISLVLLVCYCAAYVAFQKDKAFLAGILLSVAAIKFQMAIPVVLLFVIWKRWRIVVGFLTGFTFLIALSAWIIGPAALVSYTGSLAHIAGTVSAGTAGLASTHNDMFLPERMPNIHGLVSELLSTHSTLITILTMTLSILTLVWAARKPASLPFALLTAMLISYHMEPHDLTLMLLPLSLAVEQWMSRPAGTAGLTKRLAVCAVIALILLTPPVPLLLMGSNLSSLLVLPVAVLALWIASGTSFKCLNKIQP